MLERKINNILKSWKSKANHNPLVIKGCRQCGKTFSVIHFGEKNYKNVVYFNFLQNPEYISIFNGSLEIDHLTMLMSAVLGEETNFVPNKTLIIFDEIQECPEARTALKFFKIDGRFDVIATGSLLGVKGYGKASKSIPVGYETIIDMYPLDFEEFLWANGISEKIINYLKDCFQKEVPVPEALHNKLMSLLNQYVVVGGMPAVVEKFITNKNYNEIFEMQKDIIRGYEDDMIKYAANSDKANIKECFQSIPKQLAKENKKFQYSLIKKNAIAAKYSGSLQWIEDAGIIRRCYNTEITELPLDGHRIQSEFKVYMTDIGLLISMLEEGTQSSILQGDLLSYHGAIKENLLADIFGKMGRKLYYFHKDSGVELDFLIRYCGQCMPVECKATTGNAKSLRTVLGHPEKYHVAKALKLGDYNVGRKEHLLTLPMYMAFLLTEY